MMDVRTGLATVCKFLPTPADIHGFLKAKREAEAVSFRNPKPTGAYAFTRPDFDADKPLPQTEKERRAAVVRQALGYNPADKAREAAVKRTLTEPTAEDIANLKTAKATKCDATPYLIAQLEAEGWPFIPGRNAPPSKSEEAA